MQLAWRAKARADLRRTLDYIGDRNEPAAFRLRAIVARTVEQITAYPYMYRPGRISGTREAVIHPNYIIVYRVTVDKVTIVAVIHSRQQYP